MSRHNLTTQELHSATEAFKTEAQLLAGLIHPNLPRIYDQFSEQGSWYLVMGFIEGEPLSEYLTRKGARLFQCTKYACIHLALDEYIWIETTAAAADSRCLWGTRAVEALDAAIPSVGLRSRAARASAHR
jgi:hypothetical protein